MILNFQKKNKGYLVSSRMNKIKGLVAILNLKYGIY